MMRVYGAYNRYSINNKSNDMDVRCAALPDARYLLRIIDIYQVRRLRVRHARDNAVCDDCDDAEEVIYALSAAAAAPLLLSVVSMMVISRHATGQIEFAAFPRYLLLQTGARSVSLIFAG